MMFVGHGPDGNWHFPESTPFISHLKHFLILLYVRVSQSFLLGSSLNV